MEVIIEKRKRKSILIKITNEGVKVLAPWFCTKKQIQAVLEKKVDWINKQLKQTQLLKENNIDYGKKYVIIAGNKYSLLTRDTYEVTINDEKKYVICPQNSQQVLLVYIKARAYDYLKTKLEHISNKINIEYSSFKISFAKTKWGSCNSKKLIALNYRLFYLPQDICDYVIIHELCHIKQFNHSKIFWSNVEALCPDFKQKRKELHNFDYLLNLK